uniref:G-type lectin S-receptor-like serine/threonine-protein kinase RLK1 n=1 Tax=Ciona intestinalis TaxID=7719 RepID=UPI000180B1FF|nr:G-type lectin S-receptor-like serine/threonine-protein kinase RLK1 [Ciona intestinalis]|eukprot:XP_018672854.1 G-type lectin S-receptor-like serine/threonine-protein kinase RLK1 [Ciona intestinalis]
MAESHMKMAESHMKMAESHMKFKTRSFTFECSGDAVKDGLKIAEKAVGLSNSFTVSTDLGFVGVSGTLVWQTKNPEKYAEAVNRGILGNVENAFVQSFTPGSLTVEVVALKKTAADAIMEMHESGEIKKNLNKAIKEYADQHHHGLGQFDHVLLTNNNEHTVTKQEIDKVQRVAISSFKTLKREQKLDLPIWRNPTEIKTTKDETAVIGHGGFGVVLLGYCEQIGRCAVKCIGTPNTYTACKVEKIFIREAGIILLAHHANIVQVYGITSWVGSFGIIMEYMERGNLSQLIQSVRLEDYIIPFDLLVRILLQVANGVAFLHRIGEDQQIVHGDLKPSNVVLKDDFTAKVTDFGGATLRTYTNTGDAYREADDGQNTMPYTAQSDYNNRNTQPPKHLMFTAME